LYTGNVRRSSFAHLVVIVAMLVANCFSAVAGERVRTANDPLSGEHLIALRAAPSTQVASPRFKSTDSRVLLSISPYDQPRQLISFALERAATVDVDCGSANEFFRAAPAASRPPPRA
jgi:hypothetical protein